MLAGPLVSQLQFDRVTGFIKKGIEEGAKVEIGGERHGSEGYFVQPTIFSNVKETDTISKAEIFGPLPVFTRDISRALETANRLQAGTVWINTYNGLDAQDAFGGYKQSGIGRELGEYALANYTNVKAVHVNPEVDSPTRRQENANSYDYDHHRDRDTESLMAHRPRLRSCSFDSLVPSLLCDSGPNTRILVQSTNRAEPVERLSSPSTKECLLDSEDAVPCNESVQIVSAVSTLRHKQGKLRPDKEVRKRNTRSL
ncbi:hypothetical protein A4X13_0g8333 [Tilletia indica]|uniref:Aldehyde dehydrogenase domain-containing protein n=1 Tax=Tilletia indica TaxID=43049 RepID=A0A8T8SFP7_9BASI|nr:hypothetical protein A4X13_0g8333 [Tilletia indica]